MKRIFFVVLAVCCLFCSSALAEEKKPVRRSDVVGMVDALFAGANKILNIPRVNMTPNGRGRVTTGTPVIIPPAPPACNTQNC